MYYLLVSDVSRAPATSKRKFLMILVNNLSCNYYQKRSILVVSEVLEAPL